jgi:hypothetical protein
MIYFKIDPTIPKCASAIDVLHTIISQPALGVTTCDNSNTCKFENKLQMCAFFSFLQQVSKLKKKINKIKKKK